MRIGYVIPSLDDTTGWGRWTNDFLKHIRRHGVEPVLWAPVATAPQARALEPTAAYVLPPLFDSLRSAAGIRALPSVLRFVAGRRDGVDLEAVHSLDAYPWCLYGHAIASARRVPHLITSHGRYGYIAHRRWMDRVPYRRVLRSCARFITVSDAVRRAVLRHFAGDLPAARTAVLWNAVDAEAVDAGVAGVDASASEIEGAAIGSAAFKHAGVVEVRGGASAAGAVPSALPPAVISVTRFIKSKGIETAVRAFARVRQQVPDAQYLIVGPGNSRGNAYYARVLGIIREHGIEGITITGRLGKAELADHYRRSRLLLHTAITLPDDFEAYGLILLEAGVFGLPVVATRSGGHEEVITDGRSGFLVPEGDVDAVATAVVALLRDPALSRALGEENRRVALARNWSWYCGEQMRLYADAMCEVRPPRC